MQMSDLGVAGNHITHLGIEGDEAHGILLAHEQVGE
jgi:hypothetical protein